MSEEKKKWVNPHTPNARWDHSAAARVRDLFPEQFILGMDVGNRKLSPGRRRRRAHGVFFDFLRLAVEEVMADNSKIVFPCNPALMLYIRKKPRRSLGFALKGRREGTYRDVSLPQSDGRIYEYALWCKAALRMRPVRIGHTKYHELIRRVNGGQRYHEK